MNIRSGALLISYNMTARDGCCKQIYIYVVISATNKDNFTVARRACIYSLVLCVYICMENLGQRRFFK